jgi:tRNA(Ile)-lysidine synthase
LVADLVPENVSRIAVAVSGGPDSMALLRLAARWAKERRVELHALTVDHRLRAESAAEAKQVAAWCAALGVEHKTLVWRGAKPRSNIHAEARLARYGLLIGWCKRDRVSHLLVAHHLEDQAETVLLRLGRGSGVAGLAGMRPKLDLDGVAIVRPLLAVPKARLLATLEAFGQASIDDPSNRNEAYQRVQVRQALTLLAPAGVAAGNVAATAARMRRVEAALAAATAELLDRAMPLHKLGWCRVDVAALAAAPEEIALRALRQRLCQVGGDPLPPRLESLEGFREVILAGGVATLHRCAASRWRGGMVLCRELRHLPAAIAPPPALWDGRFALRREKSLTVAPLGRAGVTTLRKAGFPMPDDVPGAVLPVLPAFLAGGEIVAVPSLGYFSGAHAKMTAVFVG